MPSTLGGGFCPHSRRGPPVVLEVLLVLGAPLVELLVVVGEITGRLEECDLGAAAVGPLVCIVCLAPRVRAEMDSSVASSRAASSSRSSSSSRLLPVLGKEFLGWPPLVRSSAPPLHLARKGEPGWTPASLGREQQCRWRRAPRRRRCLRRTTPPPRRDRQIHRPPG